MKYVVIYWDQCTISNTVTKNDANVDHKTNNYHIKFTASSIPIVLVKLRNIS